MTKYDFSNNNHEEIDLPSIIKINKSLISITHASGTDYKNIPDEGNLEIQIGNIGSYDPPSPDPLPDPGPDPDPDPQPDPDPLPTPLYVDLGLGSGTLWTTGNIVKSNGNYSIGNPTDSGCYFSWANVDGYNDEDGYEFTITAYDNTAGGLLSISQNEDILGDSTYDAATVRLGLNYMLPTKTQILELLSLCTPSLETINGIDVVKYTASNGKYVIFPFAGYYDYSSGQQTPSTTKNDCRFWTSIGKPENNPNFAQTFICRKENLWDSITDQWRRIGCPIRAVFVNNQS